MRVIFCLCLVALAACAEPPPVEEVVVEVPRPVPGPSEGDSAGVEEAELCDAEMLRGLVGSPVSEAGLIASSDLRIFGVNDIITQDFLPERTNVVYGIDGLIMQVYCG